MSITKHCWPTPWLEAAMNAGFVTYRGEDEWTFINDQMRDMLAAFGGALVAAEREQCARLCETFEQQHEEMARVGPDFAAAIRGRNT